MTMYHYHVSHDDKMTANQSILLSYLVPSNDKLEKYLIPHLNVIVLLSQYQMQ